MKKVTASIVTYENDTDLLQETVTSVLQTAPYIQLCIVDNSRSNRIADVFEQDSRISYVQTEKNIGFGAAHNIAIEKYAKDSQYHIIINPDIKVPENTIDMLYAYMEENPDIGAVMPKVCDFDGNMQYLCKILPDPLDMVLRRFRSPLLTFLFKRKMEQYEMSFADYDVIFDAPHISGCFMFVRSAIFDTIGAFDERYFMYFEDVDFSRRMHSHYRTVYYPECFVYHKHEKGSYKSWFLLLAHIASAIKYFNKWGWVGDTEKNRINNAVSTHIK